MIKILFVGTGDFGLPVLKWIEESKDFELAGIVTQPDKPAGRGNIITQSPIKQLAQAEFKQVKIWQPEKLRAEVDQILEQVNPDLIIVAAYGQMIPKVMLDHPKFGCLNIHGSILPRWRGAVPIPMSLLHGDASTGVTLQQMVMQLDAGDIIAAKETEIIPGERTGELKQRLSILAVELLAENLLGWCQGKIQVQPQNESEVTFCYQDDISKEKAEITTSTSAIQALNMVRAFHPWPVAWFKLADDIVRIHRARFVSELHPQFEPLKLVRLDKRLLLSLKDGFIELQEIQLPGKNVQPGSNYLQLAVQRL